VRFNNTLEWRLSVFNAPDDSLREYRIGNDLIRYYSDFGLDAFLKRWSYSMNLEVKSQLFNAYPTNSNSLLSAFLDITPKTMPLKAFFVRTGNVHNVW